MCKLVGFILSNRSLLYCVHFFIWLSVCCSDWVISIILSSKSRIYPCALFILLFTTFSSAFMSANEFSNFSWLLLLLASFYSNLHLCWQSFIIPSVFSLPPFWTRCLLDWRGLFHCLFLQGNSLGLFNREWFLYFFILLVFLLLCDFRRSNYPL